MCLCVHTPVYHIQLTLRVTCESQTDDDVWVTLGLLVCLNVLSLCHCAIVSGDDIICDIFPGDPVRFHSDPVCVCVFLRSATDDCYMTLPLNLALCVCGICETFSHCVIVSMWLSQLVCHISLSGSRPP